MQLCMRERSHLLDGLAWLLGSRLITLDVWVDATPDEVGKLKAFNMMKQDFLVEQRVKVRDVMSRPGVPFTRDNPAAIHDIAVHVEEQYQRLFGAMFEIESFGMVREITWQKEVMV